MIEFEESLERPATEEEKEYLNRALAHRGFYNAALDSYPITEHTEDDRWIIKGEK
jgi:hypothetical protein